VPIRATWTAGLLTCRRHALSRISLAAVVLVAGSHGLQNAVAEGETRSLTMHHMHTGEDISITYKRDGRYDDAALEKLNWFLRDWRKEQQTRMDPRLLDVIWEVYREVAGQEPIQVVCGYRSPETNAMLRHRSRHSGVAQFSQHTLGRAMDFYIPGVQLEQIRYAGLRLQRGGVGFYPTSGSPFVHLDTGNVRHWPRMTREQIAHVFPNGKTVHVPSDGRPLPRYAEALAEIGRRGSSPSSTSLAEATASGAISNDDAVRAGAQKDNRSFLARLFGLREPVEDTSAELAAAAPERRATQTVRVKPQLASVIPVPLMRPKPLSGHVLAATPESGVEPPVDAIGARGIWSGTTQPAAPVVAAHDGNDQPAAGASGHRFVWFSGPASNPDPAAADDNPPRPPQVIETAEAAPEARGVIGPWSKPLDNDRVPADLALAYAAPGRTPAVARRALSMGTRTEASVPARESRVKPVVVTSAATPRPTVNDGTRINDPWLRGLVVSPSVRDSIIVSALGATDYRSILEPLMRKPDATVVMTFSEDPLLGLASDAFAGTAVAFLPTLTFTPERTAQLN
jgi:uncharacterized protein YcbK (DUF882 family)